MYIYIYIYVYSLNCHVKPQFKETTTHILLSHALLEESRKDS